MRITVESSKTEFSEPMKIMYIVYPETSLARKRSGVQIASVPQIIPAEYAVFLF